MIEWPKRLKEGAGSVSVFAAARAQQHLEIDPVLKAFTAQAPDLQVLWAHLARRGPGFTPAPVAFRRHPDAGAVRGAGCHGEVFNGPHAGQEPLVRREGGLLPLLNMVLSHAGSATPRLSCG